jgi:hypothetical protein
MQMKMVSNKPSLFLSLITPPTLHCVKLYLFSGISEKLVMITAFKEKHGLHFRYIKRHQHTCKSHLGAISEHLDDGGALHTTTPYQPHDTNIEPSTLPSHGTSNQVVREDGTTITQPNHIHLQQQQVTGINFHPAGFTQLEQVAAASSSNAHSNSDHGQVRQPATGTNFHLAGPQQGQVAALPISSTMVILGDITCSPSTNFCTAKQQWTGSWFHPLLCWMEFVATPMLTQRQTTMPMVPEILDLVSLLSILRQIPLTAYSSRRQ